MHAVVAMAASVFVHGIVPVVLIKPWQANLVPKYKPHAAEGSTHPAPFVMQPFLNTPHAAVVTVVIGAAEQAILAQAEAAFYSHPTMWVTQSVSVEAVKAYGQALGAHVAPVAQPHLAPAVS